MTLRSQRGVILCLVVFYFKAEPEGAAFSELTFRSVFCTMHIKHAFYYRKPQAGTRYGSVVVFVLVITLPYIFETFFAYAIRCWCSAPRC